ncbi:MAG: hypothetical protein IPK73_20710 [Candidatus Obscuribacter sp.]|nr:hypothetical protein [Candidatus Obscuribacter sp.]MBK9276539.1 hypothetical protein [Candidatus Obscuribacter sp.]
MNPNFLKMKYVPVLGAALALVLSCGSEAKAQGSVNLKKGQLQQAGWHKSPLQVQILDDGPVVKDYRTAPANDQGFNIPIAPVGNGGGRIPEGGLPFQTGSGPVMPRMQQSSLPQAGFGTNIPARGMGPAMALPQAKMGGLGNQYANQQKAATNVAARPVGLGKPASGMRAAAAPASYGSSYGGSGGGGSYSGGGSSSSTSVRAKLLGK